MRQDAWYPGQKKHKYATQGRTKQPGRRAESHCSRKSVYNTNEQGTNLNVKDELTVGSTPPTLNPNLNIQGSLTVNGDTELYLGLKVDGDMIAEKDLRVGTGTDPSDGGSVICRGININDKTNITSDGAVNCEVINCQSIFMLPGFEVSGGLMSCDHVLCTSVDCSQQIVCTDLKCLNGMTFRNDDNPNYPTTISLYNVTIANDNDITYPTTIEHGVVHSAVISTPIMAAKEIGADYINITDNININNKANISSDGTVVCTELHCSQNALIPNAVIHKQLSVGDGWETGACITNNGFVQCQNIQCCNKIKFGGADKIVHDLGAAATLTDILNTVRETIKALEAFGMIELCKPKSSA